MDHEVAQKINQNQVRLCLFSRNVASVTAATINLLLWMAYFWYVYTNPEEKKILGTDASLLKDYNRTTATNILRA